MLRKDKVIRRHCVFKIKHNDDEMLVLKGRKVLHGHRDAEKNTVRKHCATEDMYFIWMKLSIAACMYFAIGEANIIVNFM